MKQPIDRIRDIYRPAMERSCDFCEVERPLTTREISEQSERCMACGIPFCHGTGCPLGNVIPEMNAAVHEGKWRTAYEILSETSSFPEFTSRVCPALCEGSCVHAINDEAVMIRQIEKAIIETAFAHGWPAPCKNLQPTGKRVAVIGSGPAGLGVADALSKRGHGVTVFEKNAFPGGLLRYGIPDFKLEKQVIDRRIAIMEANGVHFECNTAIGEEVSAEYLNKRFDAVVIAIGTPIPRNLNVPGRELANIHFALDFLGGQNRAVSGECTDLPISATAKNVVVIGGGDTGSDCVGTAIRQRASSIIQLELLPQPPEKRSRSTPWPDWPYLLRTSSSHKEGGERRWSTATKQFIGDNGKVTAIETVRLEWELSPLGRPVKFQEIPESNEIIPADLVLLAMGFTGVPADGIAAQLNLQISQRGALSAAHDRGIFVCGDAAHGPSLVVRALADAGKTARLVDAYLQKGKK